MNKTKEGYPTKSYNQPVKRYCQTMDMSDNPEFITKYKKRHSKEHAWQEIIQGINAVGILEMEIYMLG